MNLTHCVVHEVEKAAGESSARVHYAASLLPVTDDLVALLGKLVRSFGGSRLVNARFDEGPGKLFPQKFADYVGAGPGDERFLAYSRELLGHLETVIQGKSGAKGGYVLLAAYDDAEGHHHGVFLLRNTVGRIFRRDGEDFAVEPVVHLDTEQLAMAARINVARYRQRAGAYLELTHRTESEVSAYFSDWIGAEATLSSKAMTSSLQDLLGMIEVEAPAGGPDGEGVPAAPQSRAETFERAYEVVRANPQKVVDIHELSQELYGSPARIEQQARAAGIELEPEFRYDGAALRELVQLRAAGDGLDLRFPRAALEDGLMYVEGEGEGMRVVIESAALAQAILNKA